MYNKTNLQKQSFPSIKNVFPGKFALCCFPRIASIGSFVYNSTAVGFSGVFLAFSRCSNDFDTLVENVENVESVVSDVGRRDAKALNY